MLSCPRGEHCDRHPRFFAGLRLDCGNDHQLCVGCILRWLDEGNDGKLCPMCRQQIANDGCDFEELKELIMKLQADETMTKMDPAMRLPTELTTEIFRFVPSVKMPTKLLVSRVIHSEFLTNTRKNGWNIDSRGFGELWSGGRDVVVSKSRRMLHVKALRPLVCGQQSSRSRHQVNYYFEVKLDWFEHPSYSWILVGLSGPDFLQDVGNRCLGGVANSYAIGSNGAYYPAGQKPVKNVVKFLPGDVVGCGLVNSHWNTNNKPQIFFTKNGRNIRKLIWTYPMQGRLYPTIGFRGIDTKMTANFGSDPAKPFLYDVNKRSDHLQEPETNKGMKRKASDTTMSVHSYWQRYSELNTD